MKPIIAGIDVHKRMLAVVVGQIGSSEGEWKRAQFGTQVSELLRLRQWLSEQGAGEVVMESTAQYWRPVWMALEGGFGLHLAQAGSNRGPAGRKTDFADAERLVRRHGSGDLVLSFVPEPQQRTWRMLSRGRARLVEDRVRVQNQIENLLEETQIKLSSVVSDLLGSSGRRILEALAQGQTHPEELAELADYRLRISREELIEALRGSCGAVHQQMLRRQLQHLALLERQMQEITQELAQALEEHGDAIARLVQMPGMGPEAAQQIVAEAGAAAQAFASPAQFASWIGVCPGRKESAGESRSDRSPKGNRTLRRVLTQVAWAAVRTKGSRFQGLFQRLVVRLGALKAIWAIAHRIARVVWLILHEGATYRELGPLALDPQAIQRRKNHLIRQMRALGFQAQLQPIPPCLG